MGDIKPSKSSGSKNKWLIGLGIGCGAVIVIVVVLFIGGYFFIRNLTQGFKESEDARNALTTKYGATEEYCPPPKGEIEPDRLEVFLSVRDSFAPFRLKLEAAFEELATGKGGKGDEPEAKSTGGVLSTIRTGFGVLPQVADCLTARNEALLKSGMGMGEYLFIYITAYNSWLRKPPEDGPEMEFKKGGGVQIEWKGEETADRQQFMALRRVQRVILPMLKNQWAKSAPERAGGSAVQAAWLEMLAAEIKAMETDRRRLPWQDGLPKVLETSLKPFRERLEAAYSRTANVFEVAYEFR